MDQTELPWAKPNYWGREREWVADALSSSWISGGAYLDQLESEIGRWMGVDHALAVSNGTTAIHLAFLALGLKPGDEVIIPGFAFLAAANVALHMGATPVFADVDSETWCATAEDVARRITPRTRAVVLVHTYGNACDIDPVVELCRTAAIPLIEDAAEAFGTRHRGRLVGSIGDIGTLSFQATKTITTGEGGMVLTSNAAFVAPMKLYRSHGMLARRYWHEVAGHNFRLTNLQAALGCAQFACIDDIINARRAMGRSYAEALDGVGGIEMQLFKPEVDPVLWAFAVRLDGSAFPQGRDAVIEQMQASGIETRNGFCSPADMSHLYGPVENIPTASALSAQVISLPSYPTLTPDEIERVCTTLTRLKS